jgi:uncharacterized protein (DUF885 family)
MKKIIAFLIILSSFYISPAQKNEAFEEYKSMFIENLWKLYPEWATNSGYYKYNHILTIPNEAFRQNQLDFSKAGLAKLELIDFNKLSLSDKTDYYLMRDFMQSIPWQVNTQKEYEWNPSNYNVSGDFSYILYTEYAPLIDRLNTINEKLKSVPAYFEEAKKNIKNPTLEHTKLAIDQNKNSIDVFDEEILKAVEKSSLREDEKNDLYENCKKAKTAILSYVSFLEKLHNPTPRSYRLGNELYAQKFLNNIQSEYSADQIYKMALERKKYLHEQMYATTRTLWKDYFTNIAIPNDTLLANKMMIDTLSVQHVKAEDFQSSIEKHIPLLVDFINKKQLIYLDPSKPLDVRKEPAYMAGVAGASISSPGPYDKNGKTFYNVGSLEGWSYAEKESYLREYNNYILQILDIHEAIPGHYTQGIYANQSPSLIKSILGNGTMIEGWAVYSELMMIENGYGNNTPEMWLMYYKWNLRSTCNTILDIGVHTQNMSKEDAISLLTKQAFQQEAEANGKWNRVQLSSVQLCSYFTGFKEIIDLREAYKKMKGSKYSLKEFNEKFLSYGSVPVKYIKELMLNEK